MTTNDGGRPEGVAEQVVTPPTAIDDVALDRIATNLMDMLPGAARAEAPLPAGVAAPAGISPDFSPERALSQASSVRIPQPVPVIGLNPASLPDALPLHQAPTPSAISAPATQTGLPYADAARVPTAALPSLAELPLSVELLDGSVPRLFDGERIVPAARESSAPAYYFLTPTVAAVPPAATSVLSRRIFDVDDIRRDFPILKERVHGRPLVWLDNAATTQKPNAVIDRLVHYYTHEYSNVHRGAHELAARSTDAYENARAKVQRFLGASAPEEIVFVRGTTEAVNLVAGSYGRKFLSEGDEIVLTTLEHHSNIVPWQFLAKQVGAIIRVVPITDRGEVLLSDFERTLTTKTRFVALAHVSNALGTILPAAEMIRLAHRRDARVLIDGAQAVSHFPVNVQELDADFYALSGHKMFGPSAIGVLYGKKALLDEMPPWQGGGNMIQQVKFEGSTFADPPGRFEAGTAALGPAVGLGAAVDYLERIGMNNVARHERELLAHASEALGKIPGVRLVGTAPDKAGVVSFVTDKIPTEEMGKILDQEGIAVRAGHHCAQPTMNRYGLDGTVRPSFALYNTHQEIDQLASAVRRALVA